MSKAAITNLFFDCVYDRKPVQLRELLESVSADEANRLLSMQYAPKGTEKKLTPLMIATVMNITDIAKVLLEKGADPHQMSRRKINSAYEYNATPLWVAASYGHLEVCRLLIAHGANIELGLEIGMTPLAAACGGGQMAVVVMLVTEHGANIEARDHQGATPMMHAAASGHANIVRFLLAKISLNH